jgi:hypothetical protein
METANQAPAFTAALPDTTITAGVALAFVYAATDPDGDPLTYALSEGPQDATLEATTGTLAWTPTAAGDFTLTVEASDGSLSTSTSATVTVLGSTAVEDEDGLPRVFALHQNYPNPFNPTTTIRFDLREAATVHVDIIDVLGRVVMTVPEQEYASGANQSVEIDAARLPSGMYLYRVIAEMEAQTSIRTGRMMLVK